MIPNTPPDGQVEVILGTVGVAGVAVAHVALGCAGQAWASSDLQWLPGGLSLAAVLLSYPDSWIVEWLAEAS